MRNPNFSFQQEDRTGTAGTLRAISSRAFYASEGALALSEDILSFSVPGGVVIEHVLNPTPVAKIDLPGVTTLCFGDSMTLFVGAAEGVFEFTLQGLDLAATQAVTLKPRRTLPVPAARSLATDGETLLVAHDRVVSAYRRHDLHLSFELSGHRKAVRQVLLLEDVVFTASNDGSVKAWRKECIASYEGHSAWCSTVAVSPTRLYSGGYDGSLICWPFPGEEVPAAIAPPDSPFGPKIVTAHPRVEVLQLTPHGLVSGGSDGRLRSWSAELAPGPSIPAHNGPISWLQFSSPYLVSAAADNTLKVWKFE